MNTIKLSQKTWLDVVNKVYNGVPNSVKLLRRNHKEVMGFTIRYHTAWENKPSDHSIPVKVRVEYICLDFDSGELATLFRLRYL